MKKINILLFFYSFFISSQILATNLLKKNLLDKPAKFLGKNIEVFKKEIIVTDSSGRPLLPNGAPAKPWGTLINRGDSFYDAFGTHHLLMQDGDGNWSLPLLAPKNAFLTKTSGNTAAYLVLISSYIGSLVGLGIGLNKFIPYIIKHRKISRIKELIISGKLDYFIVNSEVLNRLKTEYLVASNEETKSEKLNELSESILKNKLIPNLNLLL